MTDIFTQIDTSRIKKQIEKQFDSVIKAQVDEALLDLMPTKDQQKGKKPSMPTSETPVDADWTAQRDAINADRKDKKQADLRKFADFLAQHYAGCRTVELNKSQIAKDFGKSARTIDRYIAELQQMDIINGHVDASLIAQM